MIGATDEVYQPGRYFGRMRRSAHEPWVDMPFIVVRQATYAEYLEWHKTEGIEPNEDRAGIQYYEILVD
jgi:hypothetical protein